MIAGWDFSQYFGASFLTIDGATFTGVLSGWGACSVPGTNPRAKMCQRVTQ